MPLGLIALGLRDATRADSAASSVLISPWSTAGKVGRLQTADSRESASIHAPRRGLSLPAMAVAAMPGAGLMIHSLWLYQQTGVWFAWAQVHAAWGRTVTAAVPEGALDAVLSGGLLQTRQRSPVQSLNALGLVFAMALLAPVWRRLGPAWTVYVLVSLVPPLFAGGLLSLGRLTSTLFPLFLALASMLPPRAIGAVAAAFGLMQGLIAALFYTWREMY